MKLRTPVILVSLLAQPLNATQPPAPGSPPPGSESGALAPPADFRRINQFTFKRALKPLMNTIRANRSLMLAAELAQVNPAMALGPTAVTGERSIPVVLTKYSGESDPYLPTELWQELFSEEWPTGCAATQTCTGTMRQFYRENSYGRFTVTGDVLPWAELSRGANHYQGADYIDEKGVRRHCKGICPSSKMADLIQEAVALNGEVRWEEFDNDGPDGVPNSGDDDGYVDFVAFVHPDSGGECGAASKGIWSHRFSLSDWSGSDLETSRTGVGGARIRIDDYVIMPAFSCDETTMIQIGVFAHEFGHAFGLPDLYDTSYKTSGLGSWCLMAAGSWGGDGLSPEMPTHMSPWAKEFLGWTSNVRINADAEIPLHAFESTSTAIRIPISATQYYLVSNVARLGFNARLPTSGLAVWRVNATAVNAGLNDNTVNAKPIHGIELVQADGLQQLRDPRNRGDAGDLFPGTSDRRSLESSTVPASIGSVAVCGIGDPSNPVAVRLSVSSGTCMDLQLAPSLLNSLPE